MIEINGAGVGRIGTHSLQNTLETLLTTKCYPMFKVEGRPDNIRFGQKAENRETLDWSNSLLEWSSVVDYPFAAFWEEVSEAYPNAPTIRPKRDPGYLGDIHSSAPFKALKEAKKDLWKDVMRKAPESGFEARITNKTECFDSYRAHNQNVEEKALPDRLFESHPRNGWEPQPPYPHCLALQFLRLKDTRSIKKIFKISE